MPASCLLPAGGCCRFYWSLAAVIYSTYAAKLVPHLNWAENAQNLGMVASLVALLLLNL